MSRYSAKELEEIRQKRLKWKALFDGGMKVCDISRQEGVSTAVIWSGFKALRLEKERAESAKAAKRAPKKTICADILWCLPQTQQAVTA